MALLFMDSFDHYATGDLFNKWTARVDNSYDLAIASGGRTGNCLYANVLGINTSDAIIITPTRPSLTASGVVGFAAKVDVLGRVHISNNYLLGIYTANVAQLGCRLWNDGTMTVTRNDTNSTYALGTTTGPVLSDGVWSFIELKWVINNSAGSIEVRVNGTSLLTIPTVDTQSNTVGSNDWTSVRLFEASGTLSGGSFGAESGGCKVWIDDFYLLDLTDSGITGRPNNDFLGDVSVRYMAPTSDSAVTWDRSGGSTNYSQVAEGGSVPQTPDGDTTYVSTSTVDEIDYYGFPDVTAGATVCGVQAVVSAKKGDTGAAQIAACVKTSGGSDREHPTPLGIASDSSYSYFLFPWDGSPETGSAWTESEVNGAAFGPRKTA